MTREEWELRCARRFQDVGGLEAGEAAAFAGHAVVATERAGKIEFLAMPTPAKR